MGHADGYFLGIWLVQSTYDQQPLYDIVSDRLLLSGLRRTWAEFLRIPFFSYVRNS